MENAGGELGPAAGDGEEVKTTREKGAGAVVFRMLPNRKSRNRSVQTTHALQLEPGEGELGLLGWARPFARVRSQGKAAPDLPPALRRRLCRRGAARIRVAGREKGGLFVFNAKS